MTRAALLLAAGVALVGNGCLRPCRGIDVTPLPVACEDTATFVGELQLDDAATFRSFLEVDCMPSADDDTVGEIVDAVDFGVNAVFVAADVRAQLARCLSSREAEEVEVCEDGLRVPFADKVTDADPCPGKWTVAFALPRSELRAATED